MPSSDIGPRSFKKSRASYFFEVFAGPFVTIDAGRAFAEASVLPVISSFA